MRWWRCIVGAAAILLALAVILGAFGAHALEGKLTTDQLASYRTANFYHFIHSLGILAIGLLFKHDPKRGLVHIFWMLFGGILLFSGSVYLLSCRDLLGISSWTWLGPVTPFGGILFILGWLYLALLMLFQVKV